jgi:hypothetical protein
MADTTTRRYRCLYCGRTLNQGQVCPEHDYLTRLAGSNPRPSPPPPPPPPPPWWLLRLGIACVAVYWIVRICIYASGLIWFPAVLVCTLLWLCVSVRPNAPQLHKWLAVGTACLCLVPLAAYAIASGFDMTSNPFSFGPLSLGDTLLVSAGICAVAGAIALCIWKLPRRQSRRNPGQNGSESRWQTALGRFFMSRIFNRLNGDPIEQPGGAQSGGTQAPPQQPPPPPTGARRVAVFTGPGRPPTFTRMPH